MIKFQVAETLTLVIDEENIKRMKNRGPIVIDLQAMGSPQFRFLQIGFSADLKATMKELEPFIGPDTRIHGKEN